MKATEEPGSPTPPQWSSYRLLILATRYAVPPDSGYAVAVHGAVEQLAKQGVDVRVLFTDDGNAQVSGYPDALLAGVVRLGRRHRLAAAARSLLTGRAYVACKWYLPRVVDLACRLRTEWPFDLVEADQLFHMANALAIQRRCGVKVVLRSQNVEHLICRRMARAMPAGWRRLVWQREARLLEAQEAAWCRAADLVLPISDEDGAVLRKLAPGVPMVTIRAGGAEPAAGDEPAPPAVPVCFLHLGSLDWPPCREGLLWFLREVWPLVRERIPDARLLIAGSVADGRRADLGAWHPHGVDILGYVQDLAPVADPCAALVVPMRCGGGIKIRVLTAWANGWPVAGTTGLGEGLPVRDEVNCLMADEPAALATALQRVATDGALRERLIAAGRETGRTLFSWEAIGRALQAAHLACLGRS
jgi:glycosyltransferase involved in cell wall biosynthesis